ncbi:MAG TPA: PAS domain S-box protein, partial [Acidobacteriota bacterium]|nr:PAS domain S-box protein [Acidobacteriota bacterium]
MSQERKVRSTKRTSSRKKTGRTGAAPGAPTASRPSGASARRLYEELREFVPVGLLTLSPAGVILEANHRGARTLGSPPERILGRSFFDFISSVRGREACRKSLLTSLQARTRERVEVMIAQPGVRPSTVALEFAARGSGRSRVIQVSLNDLTDRIAAERHSSRLLAAVEQASDAIAVVQPEGTILYVNRSFETIYGTSGSDALAKSYFTLLASTPADARWVREARDAMARGLPWRGRVKRLGRESRPLVLELEITPVRDGARSIFSFLIIERDMTRQSDLEEHLRRIQKSEAIGAIAGGIAHDLNNVLGPIIINAELAQLDAAPDGGLKSLLDGILKSAYRARDLVRQVMAFSSPRSAVKDPVRLSDVI